MKSIFKIKKLMPQYTANGFISPTDAQTMSANEKSAAQAQNAYYGNYPQASSPSQPMAAGTTTQMWVSNYDGGRTDNCLPKQGTTTGTF